VIAVLKDVRGAWNGDCERPARGLGEGPGHPHRLAGERGGGVAEQLRVAGHAVRHPLLLRLVLRDLGGEVEQGDRHLVAGRPVDGGVVDLREHRDVAVLHALDHPHLPERTGAVERDGGEPAHERGQLLAVAGRGQRGGPDVVVEVEVRVLDPQRVVQAEGHLGQPPPERRGQVEPLAVDLLDPVEVDGAVGLRRVEDHQARDVHVRRRRLEVEERCVETGEALHGDLRGGAASTARSSAPGPGLVLRPPR
jgi:hypothetical protein